MIAFEHCGGCPGDTTCKFRGPADCSCAGRICHLQYSAHLTQKEARQYQRKLDAATLDEEVGRVIAQANTTGYLRMIEKDARAQRVHQLRTDRPGYMRETRLIASIMRAENLARRKLLKTDSLGRYV